MSSGRHAHSPPEACHYCLLVRGCPGAQEVDTYTSTKELYLCGWSWPQASCQSLIVRGFVLQHENEPVSKILESWKVRPRETLENQPASSPILKWRIPSPEYLPEVIPPGTRTRQESKCTGSHPIQCLSHDLTLYLLNRFWISFLLYISVLLLTYFRFN